MKKSIILVILSVNLFCMSQRDACVEENKVDEFAFKEDDCTVLYLLGESYKNKSSSDDTKRENNFLIGSSMQSYTFYSCLESARRAEKCNNKSPLIPTIR